MIKLKLTKPGFELVFAAGLFILFGLPAWVFGQTQSKKVEIVINNSDTTVNGKSLKDLTPTERKKLWKIFSTPETDLMYTQRDRLHKEPRTFNYLQSGDSTIRYKLRIDTAGHDKHAFAERREYGPRDRMPRMVPDMREFRMPVWDGKRGNRMWLNRPKDGSLPALKNLMRLNAPDTQLFHFQNTDKDGIHTNISYEVTNAQPEMAKRLSGSEKATLELGDLTLTPEFSSGKTMLMFSLSAKENADVKLTNSDGKILWSSKTAAGAFSKNFIMPVNGIYYLIVKQGANIAVKKLVKEQ